MTHVLIVEDHEENRTLLKMLIEANCYRVTVAGDGLEALAAARRDPPDVIVSDVLMPKLDGFALCRAWMQDARLKVIPFIFYSATNVRPEDEEFGLTLGAVRYLIKPLEAEVFLKELRAALQQWSGRAAPAPASPLDDVIFHTLHELALARKIEDKIAQLEAANCKLRESETRFRSLTEMSSDFYWESDAEHRLTQRGADNKSGAVTVFRRPTRIGERRWEIPCLSPDESGWQAHRAVLDAHRPFREFEFSRLGADGAERYLSISGDPAFDASGAFAGYRGVGTDITERKRAENALRESEASFRSLFESMLNGFAYCRMQYDQYDRPVDFVYLKVNDAFQRLTGLKNVVGRRVSEVIPGIRELSPELFETYGRVASTGIPEAFEFDFKSMSKWLTISVYSPQTGYFVAIFDDITERKLAERALVDSEQRFRGLVEQSIAGIYIIQDGKFAYVNPRFAEIRGFASADELIGRDSMPLIAEKDRDTVTENNRRLLAGETRSISYSFTALRKDGSAVEVGVHGSYATYCGRPAVIGLLQDISEKKRAEEQIQRYVAQIESAFMSTVRVVTALGEMRDPYTAGHQRRVAEIAVALGAELGFDARRQEGLRVAGYLHDVGKIRIPSEILSKPGKLSPAEFQLIQVHPQASYDVLKDVEFPWPVAEVALQHHERMDGSGYPQSLKGEAILLEARIMAVADVIEAMSSHRPYRAGLGIKAALSEIERGRGSVYDTEVADACLRLFRERRYQLPA